MNPVVRMNHIQQVAQRRTHEILARWVKRVWRFVCSCIRLRSISLAAWVDAYDNHVPKYDE